MPLTHDRSDAIMLGQYQQSMEDYEAQQLAACRVFSREAERQGVYRGSADDARDGFIHFSTASQVPETLRKHFFGQRALFLVEVDGDALGGELRWERSRNEELFPHLYGELDLGAVISVINLNMRSDGSHDSPELLP